MDNHYFLLDLVRQTSFTLREFIRQVKTNFFLIQKNNYKKIQTIRKSAIITESNLDIKCKITFFYVNLIDRKIKIKTLISQCFLL